MRRVTTAAVPGAAPPTTRADRPGACRGVEAAGVVRRGGCLPVFQERVPCGECRAELDEILKALPCPADPSGRFAWGVEVHNRVNRKLGKREWGGGGAGAVGLKPES